MDDEKQPDNLIEPTEAGAAKTQKLPRVPWIDDQDEEDFQSEQSQILALIAANRPLEEILNRLVLAIEAQAPGMLCSVLLLSDDGDHVRHGAAPSLPTDYIKAIDGASIGPKRGSCGTAMYRGKPVVVTDILTDPLWDDFRDVGTAAGLRACWSTPILSGHGKVLGSFAMYYREPRTPTGDEARLTEVATRIAGLAIERQIAREALGRTQVQLAEATRMGEDATSLAQQLDQPLATIVRNADRCLQLINSRKPDIDQLQDGLNEISAGGRQAVDLLTRLRSLDKD
jgi:GAF domain-containing protein